MNDSPPTLRNAAGRVRLCVSGLLSLFLNSGPVPAEIVSEEVSVHTLPADHGPHWLWVNDMTFNHIADGRATLVDGESGEYLGMLSTGLMFLSLTIPSHGREIYAAQTYYSRDHRGKRSDIVAIYDARTLNAVDEVPIPPHRGISTPTLWNAALTDNDRFMLIFNFTPAMGVSVVDVRARKFLREVETPGCVLAYPAGPARFLSLCGEGAVLDVELGDDGNVLARRKSARFFDPWVDAVQEDAVRRNSTWLFYSDQGFIHPVEMVDDGVQLMEKWSLLSAQDNLESWRPGGIQALALHEKSDRLYVVMHQGGVDSHDEPGREIWIYDLGSRTRVQRVVTKNLVASIQVSDAASPLLFASFPGSPSLDIYDGITGEYLRTISDLGYSPMVLQRH